MRKRRFSEERIGGALKEHQANLPGARTLPQARTNHTGARAGKLNGPHATGAIVPTMLTGGGGCASSPGAQSVQTSAPAVAAGETQSTRRPKLEVCSEGPQKMARKLRIYIEISWHSVQHTILVSTNCFRVTSNLVKLSEEIYCFLIYTDAGLGVDKQNSLVKQVMMVFAQSKAVPDLITALGTVNGDDMRAIQSCKL